MAFVTLHNSRILFCSACRPPVSNVLKRTSSLPQHVDMLILGNYQILSLPECATRDMIGPPDPLSNLRPVLRHRSAFETPLQRQLRELQDETQVWNHTFWTNHNAKFIKERQRFIKEHLPPDGSKDTLNADEMSEFYKQFLDKNWKAHFTYNFQWYKRNFRMVFLEGAICIEKFLKRL